MTHKAEVRATLLPGQKGTVRLHKEYGDQLICVRYRYDKLRGRRLVWDAGRKAWRLGMGRGWCWDWSDGWWMRSLASSFYLWKQGTWI